MKICKRLIILFAIMISCVCLIACNEDNNNSGSGDNENTIIPASYAEKTVDNWEDLVKFTSLGPTKITLSESVAITETAYIAFETTIVSSKDVTLTRDAQFKGDMFVVGENYDSIYSNECNLFAKLNLNTDDSTHSIVIDGNKSNCENVVGSAIFLSHGAELNMYSNVTIINCKKVENERSKNEKYSFSYPETVGGSAIVLSGASFNMYGGTISNNEVNLTEDANEVELCANGGAIYNQGTLNVFSGTISLNKAYKGGAIYNYSRAYFKGNATMTQNEATYGGVFYSADSQYSNVYIMGSTFTDNNAISSGGVGYQGVMCGISVDKNSLDVKAIFTGNSATNNGGVFCSYGSLVVKNCEMNENSVGSKGGAIYQHHKTGSAAGTVRNLEIYDGTSFSLNTALTGGGAISVDELGKCFIYGGTFSQNQVTAGGASTAGGGAIYIVGGGQVTINNGTFQSNSSVANGGAIYLKEESTITINNGTFNQNSATDNGGVISGKDEKTLVRIIDGNFTNNSADGGGCVYLTGAAGSIITGGEFLNNTVTGNGGAFYFYTNSVNDVSGITVSGGSATGNGGAFYISGASTNTITDAILQNNSANKGGGIYLTSGSSLTGTSLEIKNNSAGSGGGIYTISDETVLTLSNSSILENTSTGNGGGIYFYTKSTATLQNVSVVDNQATGNGGGLYVSGSDSGGSSVTATQLTINGNTGDKGIYIYVAKASIVNINSFQSDQLLTAVTHFATSSGGQINDLTGGE